jgi:hypothetical protein
MSTDYEHIVRAKAALQQGERSCATVPTRRRLRLIRLALPTITTRPNRAEPTTTPLQCDVKSAANGTAAFGRVKLFRV